MIRLNQKFWQIKVFICFMALTVSAHAQPDNRPTVVVSFSILGDLVAEVGGEQITLQVLVGPDQDAHMYQPRPADTAQISSADLVVVNGLGFEGWVDRLIQASGYNGETIVATKGISDVLLEDDHHGVDPHTWQSPVLVQRYIENIVAGLIAMDPDSAAVYQQNATAFLQQLDSLHQQIMAAVERIPAAQRVVVTSHDAFGYFGQAYGLSFIAPQGMSTDSEASARDVAALIDQIRQEQIPAVFVENISDPRLLEQISSETNARIGGTLYSDALSQPEGEAGTYLAMLRHNSMTLLDALAPEVEGVAAIGD
ncbi:MAG: metal ABC transporter substrate-binding protein [Thiohalomonadaceae bacterium]